MTKFIDRDILNNQLDNNKNFQTREKLKHAKMFTQSPNPRNWGSSNQEKRKENTQI